MNSTISEDVSREQLSFELAKCLNTIKSNNAEIAPLYKELLEINLSITAYIEESKKRLSGLRLDLAHDAESSQKVVEILSDKCKYLHKMLSPHKQKLQPNISKNSSETNNNTNNKFTERQQARTFVAWYKCMVDNQRANLALYLTDDATLEWFGRTIKTKKKVSAFLKYDMQCSRHDFTSVESIDKIESRNERFQRKDDSILASPLHSPEIIPSKDRHRKRRILRSNCNSPEWAEGCQPQEEIIKDKKQKTDHIAPVIENHEDINVSSLKRRHSDDTDLNNHGDGMLKLKRKCLAVTPPNQEVGQGDCLPSTSGTDSDKSHDALNAQLPKLAVECNGYIEFTRTRNSRTADAMKWERKCKVQISYSEDPLNIGEYIIWALRYTDETKCRRNLLAAFEEVAKEEEFKKI